MNNSNIKIAIDTLGCKVNQAEAEALAHQFAANGFSVVSPEAKADVYILNTCTVTSIADRKSRHWFRLARRRNPGAILVATGCYAERAPDDLSRLDSIDLVVPNNRKQDIVQILQESKLIQQNDGKGEIDDTASRTRAFVKIQDGCRNYCTYCIVPSVRGDEKSVAADETIRQIKQREQEGYQEVVITGVKIGTYRHDNLSLTELIERILAETAIPRLRLSSLQPQEITPELIKLWQNARLCRHFHLALQSGSDTVLARMKRRYTTAAYERTVALIRREVPDAAITTDIIVGFPGETEAEFQASYDFCKKMAFARMHVFSYSPRKGTLAAGLPYQISDDVKQERSERMLVLGEECVSNFSRKFRGKTMPVLCEQKSGGYWTGLTDNYIKVYLKSNAELTNQILDVKLGEVWGEGVLGTKDA